MGSKARLTYSESISSPSSTYRLIELPPNVLQDFKDNPNAVIMIKGKPEEEAVLCTATQTYAVRLAMSSNTLLLVPPSTSNSNTNNNSNTTSLPSSSPALTPTPSEVMTAVASVSSHYEIVRIAPRLHTVQEKLASSTYRGEEEEEEEKEKEKERHTFSSLARSVQASDRELTDWLRESNSILLDGYWRSLDAKFLTEVVDLILSNTVINQWPLHALDEQSLLAAMPDYNPKVLHHIISLYGSPLPDNPTLWQMDLKKLNIFRATQLLRDVLGDQNISKYAKSKTTFNKAPTGMAGKDWRLTDFMAAWQDAVPQPQEGKEENKVSESQLAGVAVVVKTGDEQYVRYLPAADVKSVVDPRDRFLRPRWKLDEFEPYVSDLAKDKLSLEQLVVKNARPIMQEGVRVYCSRD